METIKRNASSVIFREINETGLFWYCYLFMIPKCCCDDTVLILGGR